MKIDTSEFSQKFQDMRLRVLNQRKCPVVMNISFKQEEMGCWPNGTLFLYLREGQLMACFGDLVIPITIQEMFILISIATDPHSEYAGQW